MKSPESAPATSSKEAALPHVHLELVPQNANVKKGLMWLEDFVIKNDADEPIGKVELTFQRDPKKNETKAYLRTINIREDLRNRGLGRSTYLELITRLKSKEIRLMSGGTLTEDAQKMWRWLETNGYAKQVAEEATEGHAYETI